MSRASRGREGITCRELIEFLDAYVTNELPAERAVEFERHLAGCPSCRAYLATYRATIRLGRGALLDDPDGAPPDLPAELARAILAARG